MASLGFFPSSEGPSHIVNQKIPVFLFIFSSQDCTHKFSFLPVTAILSFWGSTPSPLILTLGVFSQYLYPGLRQREKVRKVEREASVTLWAQKTDLLPDQVILVTEDDDPVGAAHQMISKLLAFGCRDCVVHSRVFNRISVFCSADTRRTFPWVLTAEEIATSCWLLSREDKQQRNAKPTPGWNLLVWYFW